MQRGIYTSEKKSAIGDPERTKAVRRAVLVFALAQPGRPLRRRCRRRRRLRAPCAFPFPQARLVGCTRGIGNELIVSLALVSWHLSPPSTPLRPRPHGGPRESQEDAERRYTPCTCATSNLYSIVGPVKP